MAIFTRPVRVELDPELKYLLGERHVLAIALSTTGQVVATKDRLWYRDADGWHDQPWHEIEHGGWDQETRQLHWQRTQGDKVALELTKTGQLPDLFSERVMASIAATRVIELGTKGTAVISARRDLADPDGPLIWRVGPGKGVTAAEVEADPLVHLEVDRLRSEYDLS